jgi:glycine/D-amino acid oxidase-like deaminating enzyme
MPGYGASYWAERTPNARRRAYPAFRGAQSADVVVIGGGLTGTTAAYVFANAGLRVVLLEAGRLASGATAAGVGAIVPQPDAWFRPVERAQGVRVARAAWTIARRSALDFAAVLRRLQIRCDLRPAPVVINARSADDSRWLRREQAARRAAGVVAPWLTAAAARGEIGSDSAGALRLSEGFTFDPVRAALGFAVAAERKGATVFERSPVRRTRFTRRYADVILASGTIRTRHVFVATGRPAPLFSPLERHVREMDAYVVVTEPFSAAMRREAGRRSTVVTEAGSTPHWLRWLPDDRAVFAGGLSKAIPARQRDRAVVARTAQLMYELSLRHPAISGLPARWGWRAPVVSTADGLPWIGPHRNYPFHFFALAFGWHGDALAWFSAKAALREFSDERARDDAAMGFLR